MCTSNLSFLCSNKKIATFSIFGICCTPWLSLWSVHSHSFKIGPEMEITHFYSLLRVSVIGHHVGSGSVCSFAFIQWVRASEISIPQCCSNVEADLALKIPAHTHKMQKTPWKPTIFFLDRTTVLLLVFFNAYFNMHMLFLMWSKYIQSRHVLPRLSAWEFVSVWDKRRAKNFRES